jgi:hypothetical protein
MRVSLDLSINILHNDGALIQCRLSFLYQYVRQRGNYSDSNGGCAYRTDHILKHDNFAVNPSIDKSTCDLSHSYPSLMDDL